jgi:flagellar motor switch protein FliM
MNTIDEPQPRNSDVKSTYGIKAVLDQALQSYERLPMLEIIFDKFIRQLAVSLRHLTAEAVDVKILEFNSLRFGDFLKTIKSPASIVVFKAVEWDNLGLLVLDGNLVFSLVDILLGGKNHTNQTNKVNNNRILTPIEQGIAKQISEVVLNGLTFAFEGISPATFALERLESNPNFATISRPGDAIISLKIQIEIDDQLEKMELIIPYKTIEPVKEQMQQVFLGDKFGVDIVWEESLLNAIHNIDLPVEAVIVNKLTTLHSVAHLKVGDTIIMDHKEDESITVRSGPIALFKGKIGKVEGKIAVSLEEVIDIEN